jgi:hypothetical protein
MSSDTGKEHGINEDNLEGLGACETVLENEQVKAAFKHHRLTRGSVEGEDLGVVVVGEGPALAELGVGDLGRDVAVVVVVSSEHVPGSLEGLLGVHILESVLEARRCAVALDALGRKRKSAVVSRWRVQTLTSE